MTTLPKTIYRLNAEIESVDWIQAIKLPMVFFTELEWKNFTICMELQKIPNNQRNLEKEKCRGRIQAPCLKTVWQSCSKQNSLVLAQEKRNID